MTSYRNTNRKGGYVDYYNNSVVNKDQYVLNSDIAKSIETTATPDVYVPPNSALSTPGLNPSLGNLNMTGGNGNKKMCGRDGYKDCDNYEFDNATSFLYSFKGGCSCSASSIMGGNNYSSKLEGDKVSGGAFALTPYVTAISLLAARLLTDRQVGFFPMSGGSSSLRRSRK